MVDAVGLAHLQAEGAAAAAAAVAAQVLWSLAASFQRP